jgi:hypothetical protein
MSQEIDSPIIEMYYFSDLPEDQRDEFDFLDEDQLAEQAFIKIFDGSYLHISDFLHVEPGQRWISEDTCKTFRRLGFHGVSASCPGLAIKIIDGDKYMLGCVEDDKITAIMFD